MDLPFSSGAPALFLAPMQDITDAGFMNIVSGYGAPDVCVTEYVRIHACYEFNESVLGAILNSPAGVRVCVQFIGCDCGLMRKAAIELKARWPHIDMLDLNFGCPVHKICRKNVGGGVLRDPDLMERIVACMRETWDGCLSVKMRTGFDDDSNFEELFGRVVKHSPDFVTIHGRTVKQLYRGSVNYGAIARAVRMAPGVPIVANGDIFGASTAAEVYSKTGCAGIMVGRHAVRNPWIFRQMRELFSGGVPFRPKLSDVRGYVDLLQKKIASEGNRFSHMDSRMKKFLNFVALGVDEEGRFLYELRRARGMDELLKVCDLHMLENGNSDKYFASEPYANLCARPNHEGLAQP